MYVVLYAEIKLFLDMFKIYERMRAYRIYVTHTLTIRTAYARYARHTLNTLKVCYSYVMTATLASFRLMGLCVLLFSLMDDQMSKKCERSEFNAKLGQRTKTGLHLFFCCPLHTT